MDIPDELVLSVPQVNGTNSFTLASRLGQMLREAESMYGRRDESFTILGIEFFDGPPHIWFPLNPKNLVVRLSSAHLFPPIRAYFQLANEVIHLLDPCVGAANNLEEGIATDFTIRYLERHFGERDWATWFTGTPYLECRRAVMEISASRPSFVRGIRATKPLSKATEQDILGICPSCAFDTARFLAARFK